MIKTKNKKSLHVYIDEEVYDSLRSHCTRHGDMTFIVQEILRKHLKKDAEALVKDVNALMEEI